MNSRTRTRVTLMPQSFAATAFPPIANTDRPYAVLRPRTRRPRTGRTSPGRRRDAVDVVCEQVHPVVRRDGDRQRVGGEQREAAQRAPETRGWRRRTACRNRRAARPRSRPSRAEQERQSRLMGSATSALSRKASMTEMKATIGPTLTSISPAMMISVAPQAAIPIVAASRRIVTWLLARGTARSSRSPT